MRMRELEERSGVGRETIRFYIREGLLPEPAREGRTSAQYSDDHVVRLKAIRRLQDERYLPLSVIKALLNADTPPDAASLAAFPELGEQVSAGHIGTATAAESLSALATRLSCEIFELEDLDRVGLIQIDRARAQPMVSADDVWLVEQTVRMREAGLNKERGFTADDFRFYLEFVDWLAGEEVKLFYGHMAGQATADQAVRAAEEGIAVMNDMLAALRRRAILAKLKQFKQGT
jgi:DNA-binding transcriptional MerR regulator